MDYRRMYDDSDLLYAYDLDENDGEVTLQIEAVSADELIGDKGRKSKKPHVKFVGRKKRLALNKTNGKTVKRLYGKETNDWVGKWVTLYATTTEFDGEQRDCIRIRPERPERSDGQQQRSDSRRDRPAGNGKARSGQGQTGATKAERDAAEVSAVTARYLIGQYEAVTGEPGSEERMAALKIERGRAWETMNEADRLAVGKAAVAAKARIDAVAAGGPPSSGTAGGAAADQASDAAAPDDADADIDDSAGSEP